jgi:hypothetical protein
MVDDEAPSPDRRSSYRLFLWLRLVATIRLAFDPRKLALAAVGVVFLSLGWSLLNLTLPASAAVTPVPYPFVPSAAGRWERLTGLPDVVAARLIRVSEPVRLLTTPLGALLDPAAGWGTMVHALLGLIWLMVVWGICGGAIARLAVVQLSTARQPRLGESLSFALRSAGPLIIAPLCPLGGLAGCALVGVAFGLLYRLPGVGPLLAGAALVIPMAAGLVMTLLVAGLVAGWPLLHAALAAGADHALDAISRTFSYLNQRLGLYVLGLAMAGLFAVVGLFVVDLLAEGVIHLTHWSLSLSAPGELTAALFTESELSSGPATATHRFWLGGVRLLTRGWTYSFFWTAAGWLYLALRHEVDGTPWTEIDRPGDTPAAAASPVTGAPELVLKVPGMVKSQGTGSRPDVAVPEPGTAPDGRQGSA